MGPSLEVNRPRNVDWKRAAALLYGDWGTSKAYVIGYAFLALAFASQKTIIAVSLLTGLVGINYAIICRYFPDGGGVYSAARSQGKALAVLGALLLVADLTVTAALSGYDAIKYLAPNLSDMAVPGVTIGIMAIFGVLNSFGPRHSGALAVGLAVPMIFLVIFLIAISASSLTTNLPPLPIGHTIGKSWHAFVAAILALSGVEAIASLTGVMKLDKGSTPENPRVGREATKAIIPVAIEVVVGTILLGWAAMSLSQWSHSIFEPGVTMLDRLTHDSSHILRVIGEEYGARLWGHDAGIAIGWGVGIIVALLLFSAVNTAIAALIGTFYTLARDGEMPRSFLNLNRYGVPKLPLFASTALPVVVVALTYFDVKNALSILGDLYAIGVVGAITVNLGCCTFNKTLNLKKWERTLFAVTFAILFCVEITLAYDKHLALFFVVIIVGIGFWLRSMSHKASGLHTLTLAKEVADMVSPEAIERLRPQLKEGQKIMVAARGPTPVLRFALDEAKLRNATLCVLYVKELAVFLGAAQTSGTRKQNRWQDDPQAAAVMSLVLKLGEEIGVPVQPIYAVSMDPAATILDLAATLGADYLMLGSPHRNAMARLLKGNVVERVASQLPDNIQLIIHS